MGAGTQGRPTQAGTIPHQASAKDQPRWEGPLMQGNDGFEADRIHEMDLQR